MPKNILVFSFLFIFLMSGCHFTESLFYPKDYDEVISSIYMTDDNSQLIIMTNDFHYVFATPPGLEKIIKSKYKSYLDVSFYKFYVSVDNSITGKLYIKIKSYHKNVLSQKEQNEIRSLLKSTKDRRFSLQGKRYDGKGFQPKTSPYTLNKTYKITIKEILSTGEKIIRVPLTPITLVGDTLMIGAIVLIMLPLD